MAARAACISALPDDVLCRILRSLTLTERCVAAGGGLRVRVRTVCNPAVSGPPRRPRSGAARCVSLCPAKMQQALPPC